MASIDHHEDGVCLGVLAGEVAQGVILLGQVVATVLAEQFAEGVQRGHDAGAVYQHGPVSTTHRPSNAKRLLASGVRKPPIK